MSLRIRSSAVKVLVTPLLGLVVLNSSNRLLLSILLVHSLRVLFQVIVLLQHRSLVRKSNGHHHLPLVLLFVVELKNESAKSACGVVTQAVESDRQTRILSQMFLVHR
jgi:hypothetical protein